VFVASAPWNVNLHYDGLLDSLVPTSASRALDVGCGDGFLAARLGARVPHVTAMDIDPPVLARAQRRFPDVEVNWVHDDVLTAQITSGTFDAIVSNATLHHLPDVPTALCRLRDLLEPGGTLAVVTFVKPEPREIPWQALSWVSCTVANRVRHKWEHSAPIAWPPPFTLSELRAHARAALPGARVRRLLYGRVLLTWHAPTEA